MNPIVSYGTGVLTTFALLVVTIACAATENADAPAAIAKSHASLKTYPNAVITLKDPKTENIFYVESNGRRLVAFKKDGTIIWSVDLLEATKVTPKSGQPVIRHLKLSKDQLQVVFGNHDFAEVQINSGKTKYLGAD
jgi:hypothetical protein